MKLTRETLLKKIENKPSKQKLQLIYELSFWIIREIETLNDNSINNTKLDNKTNIKTLINVIKSSKHYTKKQIKQLIFDLKYQLPF